MSTPRDAAGDAPRAEPGGDLGAIEAGDDRPDIEIPALTARPRRRLAWTTLAGAFVLVLIVVTVAGFGVAALADRMPRGRDRAALPEPAAAAGNPAPPDAKLPSAAVPVPGELGVPAPSAAAPAAAPPADAAGPNPSGRYLVGALDGSADEARPIGVRATGPRAGSPTAGAAGAAPAAGANGAPPPNPLDSTVMLTKRAGPPAATGAAASAGLPGAATAPPPPPDPPGLADDPVLRDMHARRAEAAARLDGVRNQLRALQDRVATGGPAPAGTPAAGGAGPAPGDTTGALPPLAAPATLSPAASRTRTVVAGRLRDLSLLLPKGSFGMCVLKTRVMSAESGFVACQLKEPLWSADRKVVLFERGTHFDGEFRKTAVRPGVVRIPVIWTRARSPAGVVVDLESPAMGPLGAAGMDADVDNRWGERLGAALLVSLIQDSLRIVVDSATGEHDTGNPTVVLGSTTGTAQRLPEKVLDSTINIPPMLVRNQGEVVGLYVNADVDLSQVYELRADDAAPEPRP